MNECPGGECSARLSGGMSRGTSLSYLRLPVVVMICANLANTQTHRQLLTGHSISSAS